MTSIKNSTGGLLILTALLFIAVFTILMVQFDYPYILDRPASEVLPRLQAGGMSLKLVWWIYAMIPILILPISGGVTRLLKGSNEMLLATSTHFALLASLSTTLGLLRWASLNSYLATAYSEADLLQKHSIEVIFNGFNLYLGTFVGEQLGETFLNLWFLCVSIAMLTHPSVKKWIALLGISTAILGLIGMFRFATSAVLPFQDINNYLLPIWLIVWGVAMILLPKMPIISECEK